MANRILLAMVGTLAAAPATAQLRVSQAPPSETGLTDSRKISRADEHIARMKLVLKQVLGRLEDARSEKDIVKLNCVNEKLTQVKGLLKVSEQADIALLEGLARGEGAADAEFQKISIARAKVDQLRIESEECIGQLAFAVDERTIVEVEQPKGLPDRDLTRPEPPPPPVTRPPPVSPYY